MQEQTNMNWKVDAGHSNVTFKVRHMAIANIAGSFNVFDGTVVSADDDFADAEVTFEIDAKSLTTNNKVRDEHLNSAVFFDTDQYPRITFNGHLQRAGAQHELSGDLTIRDVTAMVKLQAAITGTGWGRWGDSRVGFELNGTIDRRDHGLTFNALTDAGGVIVGDAIKLYMDIELIKS